MSPKETRETPAIDFAARLAQLLPPLEKTPTQALTRQGSMLLEARSNMQYKFPLQTVSL